MTTTDTPVTRCTTCGAAIECATSVYEDARPSEGDYTLCLRCGALYAFNADLTLRPVAELPATVGAKARKEIGRAQGLIRTMFARRGP